MIIQPNLPTGFVIFCDDLREEVNGKTTFVGTYGGELTAFGTGPVVVPMLWIAVRYRDDPENLPRDVTFKITKHAGSEVSPLFEAKINAPALPAEFKFPDADEKDAVRFAEIAFAARISPLEIAGDFMIKVRAYVNDDDDEVRLGALQVKLAPPPAADAPTPTQ